VTKPSKGGCRLKVLVVFGRVLKKFSASILNRKPSFRSNNGEKGAFLHGPPCCFPLSMKKKSLFHQRIQVISHPKDPPFTWYKGSPQSGCEHETKAA
jgi:hypothetical protein